MKAQLRNCVFVILLTSPAILRGFDDRRRNHSGGYFIGDSILRKDENRSLASVLMAYASGASIEQARGGAAFLARAPSCNLAGVELYPRTEAIPASAVFTPKPPP